MELSFGLLLGAFAFAFVASGGAWAHAALGAQRPIYARGQWLGLGMPSLAAALLAASCLVLPQFDVSFGVLALGAGLAALGAALGLAPRRGATLARGAVWPLAACVYAFAIAEAIGIA